MVMIKQMWHFVAFAANVGARLKCHRLRKVKMTFGGSGGLTRLQLRPEPCAMAGPLSAYPVLPGCLAAAGVVDRPAYGLVDTTLAPRARTPVPPPAAYSRRSRRAPLFGSCRTPGTAVRHLGVGQRSARPGNSPPRLSCPRARTRTASGPAKASSGRSAV